MFFEITIFSFIFLGSVWSVQLPAVTCPASFRYVKTTKSNGIFGEMTLHPEDFTLRSEKYEIEVKMTMRTKKPIPGAHLEFFLATEIMDLVEGKESKYHIYFPTQKAIPGILLIKVNDKVICEGEVPKLKPKEILSTLTKTIQIDAKIQQQTHSTVEGGDAEGTPAPTVTMEWNIEWIINTITSCFNEITGNISNSLLYTPVIIALVQVALHVIWLVIQCYGF